MSTSVHDILGAIGDAQRALSAEPQYRSQIEELQKKLNLAEQRSQTLELNIIGYKGNIDNLQSKVRSLEVERDDTGFRLLETEDKLDKLVKAIRASERSLGEAVDEVDPANSRVTEMTNKFEEFYRKRVAEEGLVKPEPIAPQAAVSSFADLMPVSHEELYHAGEVVEQQPHPVQATAEGSQSAADPTVQSTESQSPIASTSAVSTSESVATSHKPYAGKRYDEVVGYVNYEDWIEGGGTTEDYWR